MEALIVNETTHRIEAVIPDWAGTENDPKVENAPLKFMDYLFINGQFIYSPLPPEYPLCEQDAEMGKIFMIDDEIYKARTAIGKGELVTPYNSEKITPADLLNALAEQKGE